MKLFAAVFLGLAALAVPVRAQDAGNDPKGGTLVDCGSEKVAVLAHTESPDGRYALGWTVRPDRNKTPVDWSSYDAGNLFDWLQKYPTDDDLTVRAYVFIDGVLDLQAAKFTPLASDWPYWPDKNRGKLRSAWYGGPRGIRYAIANNDARFGTENLWLVAVGPGGVRAADLAPAAARAVTGSLRKHTRQSNRYAATFDASRSTFAGRLLKIHFEAGIPKDTGPGYEGDLAVAVPEGTIQGVTCRASR